MNKQKSQSGFAHVIIVGVVLLALISALGFVYWQNFLQPKANVTVETVPLEESPVKTVLEPLEKAINPEGVTTLVQQAISVEFKNIVEYGTELTGDQISFNTSSWAPFWKVDNTNLYERYSDRGSSRLEVHALRSDYNDLVDEDDYNDDLVEKLFNFVWSFIIDQGFINTDPEDTYNNSNSSAFIKDDMLCFITDRVSYSGFSLACGNVSYYTTELQSYKDIKEFADAYVAAGNIIEDGTILGVPVIADSQTSGYKIARGSIAKIWVTFGATALYYKKGDGEWRYFKWAQAVQSCGDYNSEDLRAAFKGEKCYNGNYNTYEETTVQ